MNDEQTLETTPEPASGAETGPDSQEASLVEELRSLGKNLAAALRAAGQTEEAEALKADLKEGLRTLRGEMDDALSGSSVEALKGRAQAKKGAPVRREIAGAIRVLNRTLDRMAASLEPSTHEPPAEAAPEEGGQASGWDG